MVTDCNALAAAIKPINAVASAEAAMAQSEAFETGATGYKILSRHSCYASGLG